MPTTIYSCSLLTQRARAKAESISYSTRVKNLLPGYTTPLGIYNQSAINTIKDGKMKYYTKGTGGKTIESGCPCSST
jgi:hypothetical protein